MVFNNKFKVITWVLVLGFTLISCTRIASNTPENNVTLNEIISEDTPTPNIFLTDFVETENSPTNTPSVEDTPTEIVATEGPTETPTPVVEDTPTPVPSTNAGKVVIRSFDLVPLNFDIPENLSGSQSRSGPILGAIYLEDAPVIDGDITDWDGIAYAMGYVVLGQEFYSSSEDIYGVAMLGWDEDNLYLGIQVTDNKFVQTAQGNDIYRGDSLELMVDSQLSEDFDIDYLDEDDYQMGISPGNLNSSQSQAEAYLWSPIDMFGPVPEVEISSGFTDVGYTMEVAIPWSTLGVVPSENTNLGFLLTISDNDFVNQNSQQSVVSFAPERKLNDPTGWYTLRLNLP